MVDNFEQIKRLLSFDSEDDFYFVQLIQRKKEVDVSGRSNKNRIIRTYYIQNIDYFEAVEDEIKGLSDYFNARAGINLNKRSFRDTAFHLLKEVSDQILHGNYMCIKNSYNTVCGKYRKNDDKKWIVDIDDPDQLGTAYEAIDLCEPKGEKVAATLPTSSGYHIITTPFNVKQFKEYCSEEIHKNNPTALYYPN